MGFIIAVLKRLLKLIFYSLIIAAVIVFIPNLPPYSKFTSIVFEPLLPRTGPLAHNDALNNVDKVYTEKLLGPEWFQEYKGELYTSLATGEVVKLSPGGHVTFVTKLGQPCSGLVHEHICGRPLGFEIDENKGLMYIADAYHGIWKVDLKNDKKQLLVSPRQFIGGRQSKLFNAVAIGKNGDLYWTDSCDFYLKDGVMSSLTDPSGRLLHYNAARNESKVLLDDLWFANGVLVSPDNQFVLVAESFSLKITKYYIEGPKKGISEVFIAGLPGYPDNIRSLPDGSGVLVGLYTAFAPDTPVIARSLAAAPLARKCLARLLRLVEIPFEYLNTLYPHIILEEIVYYLGHFKSLSGLLPGISGLLQVDWDGNVVASYYNTDGSIKHISDAVVYNGRLYTGSPHSNFIGSLPVPPLLKKAFEKKEPTIRQAKPVATPKVEEKPKVEVNKPATPKPEAQKIKPVETKPVQNPAPKPVDQPKPAQPKPTAPSVKSDSPKAQVKQESKAAPKPEIKTAPPPKATPKSTPPAKSDDKTKPEVKVQPEVNANPATVTKPKESPKPVKEEAKQRKPEQIPIKEEIPVDTVKPTKETLKVIKKGGPAEIPNPSL